jgi:hypothetical protein
MVLRYGGMLGYAAYIINWQLHININHNIKYLCYQLGTLTQPERVLREPREQREQGYGFKARENVGLRAFALTQPTRLRGSMVVAFPAQPTKLLSSVNFSVLSHAFHRNACAPWVVSSVV